MREEVWKREDVAREFLEGTRGAIPLAEEQINVILNLIKAEKPQLENFLDLGCGDGILGRAIFSAFPDSYGVFADFYEPMLKAAAKKLGAGKNSYLLATSDFSNDDWVLAVNNNVPFDLVVSGLAIHHQPDERKKKIYEGIYELLKPGGIFLHLEHVRLNSNWATNMFKENLHDLLYEFQKSEGGTKSKDEVVKEFNKRQDSNILAPVETQCEWLRSIGFEQVDCFFKYFELAILGGLKPQSSSVL